MAKGAKQPNPELAAAQICACMSLRKTTRAVTQFFDGVMEQSGLRVTQFSLLQALVRTGPVTLSTLAQRLVMDRTTLSRNLKPLIERRLVSARPGEDRRRRVIELTERGRESFAAALPLWRKAQTRFVASLGEDNWSELLNGLNTAVEAAHGSVTKPADRAVP
jgi:DNA-binding MarR family transcriptional regulator